MMRIQAMDRSPEVVFCFATTFLPGLCLRKTLSLIHLCNLVVIVNDTLRNQNSINAHLFGPSRVISGLVISDAYKPGEAQRNSSLINLDTAY